jgi:hypothetical protein
VLYDDTSKHIQHSISLPSLCNSDISVWYFQAHTTLLFLFHTSLSISNISVWYFQAHIEVLYVLGSIIQKY